MSTLSKPAKGFPRQTALFFVKRHYLKMESPNELIQDA
jgi:hypothetical protein